MPTALDLRDVTLDAVFIGCRQRIEVQADPPLAMTGTRLELGHVTNRGAEKKIVDILGQGKTTMVEALTDGGIVTDDLEHLRARGAPGV